MSHTTSGTTSSAAVRKVNRVPKKSGKDKEKSKEKGREKGSYEVVIVVPENEDTVADSNDNARDKDVVSAAVVESIDAVALTTQSLIAAAGDGVKSKPCTRNKGRDGKTKRK